MPLVFETRYQDIARRMRPLDHVVFESALAHAGSFSCPVGDARFHDSGPTDNCVVVFPRTSVWIRHSGSKEFVADPTVSTIYNRGQEYTRNVLSGEGDRCEWFGVAPSVALEIAASIDPHAYERPSRPFASEFAPVDAGLYLAQREFFLRLERGHIDRVEAEETIIGLVTSVLKRASGVSRLPQHSRRADEAHRDLAGRARSLLLTCIDDRIGLAGIASRLGVSEFHLCRIFREQTGLTLHAFRLEVRLRTALERLENPKADLSRIALDLGFSSHSHFTNLLHKRFGRTPSSVRQALTS